MSFVIIAETQKRRDAWKRVGLAEGELFRGREFLSESMKIFILELLHK